MYFLHVRSWLWGQLRSLEHNTAQLSLISRTNGIETVQLDGDHLDQTLPQYLYPAPLCWVLSPWKPSCSQARRKRLVFAGKLGAWRLVFFCCLLKAAGFWKRFVCGWFTCQGPSQTCVTSGTSLLDSSISRSPSLPGLGFQGALFLTCQWLILAQYIAAHILSLICLFLHIFFTKCCKSFFLVVVCFLFFNLSYLCACTFQCWRLLFVVFIRDMETLHVSI